MRRAGVALLAGLVALTLLRFWWCGRFELSPDEAYYWLWSQHLDWAYFSKGPGIALAIRFATDVFGDTERGVRWLSPLLALGTTGLAWLLVRDTISRRTATATALALQCVPLFSVGALLMTIDPLSIFFWMLALLCGWRGINGGGPVLAKALGPCPPGPHARLASIWWLACGAAAGLGFLCKYTNVLVLLGIMLAAGSVALRPRHFAALMAGFLPFTLPPLLWNAQRGWPTARHLFERGGLARAGGWLQPRETLEFVSVHFGTWSPVLFAMILLALPAMLRRARAGSGPRFLLLASAPVLALYCALALHEAGEANWTGPGIMGLLPLAVDHWLSRWSSLRVRIASVAALLVGALLSLVIANTSILRACGVPLSARSDPSTRLRGWRDTAAAVEEMRRGLPVIANHYGLASELAFYGAIDAGVPRTERPKNQFWFWRAERGEGRFLFVSDRIALPEPAGMECVPAGERRIEGEGGTLRTIRAYSCAMSTPVFP